MGLEERKASLKESISGLSELDWGIRLGRGDGRTDVWRDIQDIGSKRVKYKSYLIDNIGMLLI